MHLWSCVKFGRMENKRKYKYPFNFGQVRLMQLVEKRDRKKCQIANEFSVPSNALSLITEKYRKIKMLMFNRRNMKIK